ncbi:hypothetical protein [Crocosphaera watsonii]|uniref:hypothetical protein n=1 Tax=Crocosphaera watsonii TaxID=263511 RepID=UPI00065150EC|nr:hypothetical protein [Crocosphaera watsonii]
MRSILLVEKDKLSPKPDKVTCVETVPKSKSTLKLADSPIAGKLFPALNNVPSVILLLKVPLEVP